MLTPGTKAPDFTLADQNGTPHTLSSYRGRKVILYFYPKDMTAGCTSQACAFRDLYPQFLEKGAAVLGVSKDSTASHKRFEEAHGLPFPLLSDPDLQVIASYDVHKRDQYGQPAKGLIRTTYLIDNQNDPVSGSAGGTNDDAERLP